MPTYCEKDLSVLASALAKILKSGDRVFVEGPLGAGKSTFTRSLLFALGIEQPPQGSPTFSLAHTYSTKKNPIVHIDFYRFNHEREIQEAGLEDYFWGSNAIVITEWISQFPQFEKSVLGSLDKKNAYLIQIGFVPNHEDLRKIEIKIWNQAALFWDPEGPIFSKIFGKTPS